MSYPFNMRDLQCKGDIDDFLLTIPPICNDEQELCEQKVFSYLESLSEYSSPGLYCSEYSSPSLYCRDILVIFFMYVFLPPCQLVGLRGFILWDEFILNSASPDTCFVSLPLTI